MVTFAPRGGRGEGRSFWSCWRTDDVIGRPGLSATHPEQKQHGSLLPPDWTQRAFECFSLFAVIVYSLSLSHCCVHCWIVELGNAAKHSLLLLLSLFLFLMDFTIALVGNTGTDSLLPTTFYSHHVLVAIND